ncbi:MAG: ABC transporter substrate-binding protein, partial [Butyricicoccus pullicaecorum]|nr:ABC transporter substrate-binding protein [Butyricicoccus pullicaecorum]
MQKRRLLAALLAGAMAFSLTACGSSNGDTSDSTTDSATASGASYTVGVCQLMQHVALDAATQGFQDKLTELVEADGKTVEFDLQNASGDSATCTTIVNGFVSSGVDLIMGNGTDAFAIPAQQESP